jgi:SAM-dependent MidA family methyltransferase
VHWASELPDVLSGVVVGNEVLDAMPAKLLVRTGGVWFERGVAWHNELPAFADTPTDLRPPVEIEGQHDYLTEIHPQADAFMRTLADRLKRGAAFFMDYGFGESEYYHPQRHMGTLMCHRAHQSDTNPLVDVGLKDITVHVNFTGAALAAQEAGLATLGYTSQARFLMNCGIVGLMEQATPAGRTHALKLLNEHEMGELFKVIALSPQADWEPLGFSAGDRSHTL